MIWIDADKNTKGGGGFVIVRGLHMRKSGLEYENKEIF